MVRLAAELLLLLGLLLLTLHITVLRSNPLPQANGTVSLDQDAALTEVSYVQGDCWVLCGAGHLLGKSVSPSVSQQRDGRREKRQVRDHPLSQTHLPIVRIKC